MLERIVRIVRSVADEVIVVARRQQQVPAGLTVVNDPVEDLGPLAGIAAGLAASKSDLNLVVACDMPLIKPEVLQRLVSLIGDHDACVAVPTGTRARCAASIARASRPMPQALLDSGERRVMQLLDQVRTKRVDAACSATSTRIWRRLSASIHRKNTPLLD